MKRKMVMKNQYGEIVCELQSTGMFCKVPKKILNDLFTMLDEGDTFKVVAIEVEED